MNDNRQALRKLLHQLEEQYGPNATGLIGDPILLDWIKVRDESMIVRLLESGANVNLTGRSQETALQAAVGNGMTRIVQLLLSLGADLEIECPGQPTALFRAARAGNDDLVTLLLGASCRVDKTSYANETALMSACESGHLSTVRLLLEHGADPNLSSASGWTPLHHAGMGGYSEIASYLISHGANPLARDRYGYNATDMARHRHDVMLAQAFRNFGIPDLYSLKEGAHSDMSPDRTYDVFISYKQMHFSEDADELKGHFEKAGRSVFVDRAEFNLAPDTPVNQETLKGMLARVLRGVRLTLFFEMYWDGSHGEPKLNFDVLNWQLFELLHSRRALLISHESKGCAPLVMIPGKKLESDFEAGFSYKSYEELSQLILRKYFSE